MCSPRGARPRRGEHAPSRRREHFGHFCPGTAHPSVQVTHSRRLLTVSGKAAVPAPEAPGPPDIPAPPERTDTIRNPGPPGIRQGLCGGSRATSRRCPRGERAQAAPVRPGSCAHGAAAPFRAGPPVLHPPGPRGRERDPTLPVPAMRPAGCVRRPRRTARTASPPLRNPVVRGGFPRSMTRRDHREAVDAIAFGFRTGTRRACSPEEYGVLRVHRHVAGARKRGPGPAQRPVTHGRRRPVRPCPRRRGRARRPRCSRAGGRWTRYRG